MENTTQLELVFAPQAVTIDKVKLQGKIDESSRVALMNELSSMAYQRAPDKKINDNGMNVEYRLRKGASLDVFLSFTTNTMALEFNPNHWNKQDERGLLYHIIAYLQRYLEVTAPVWVLKRVDVAFDVYSNLSEYNYAINTRAKHEYWARVLTDNEGVVKLITNANNTNRVELQTAYFGQRSNKSDLIRIYDKRAKAIDGELTKEDLASLMKGHEHYWRVEFELHNSENINQLLTGQDDLFGALTITRDYGRSQIEEAVTPTKAKARADKYNYEVAGKTYNRVVSDYESYIFGYMHGAPFFDRLPVSLKKEVKDLVKQLEANKTDLTNTFRKQWESNRSKIAAQATGYQSRAPRIIEQLLKAAKDKRAKNHDLAVTVTGLFNKYDYALKLENANIRAVAAFVKRYNKAELNVESGDELNPYNTQSGEDIEAMFSEQDALHQQYNDQNNQHN